MIILRASLCPFKKIVIFEQMLQPLSTKFQFVKMPIIKP